MNTSKQLEPFRVILGVLLDLDSYQFPGLVDKTGMQVDWSLTERENYSHKYRREALRPRILKEYESLEIEERLRVAYVLVSELSKIGKKEETKSNLESIGWTIEGEKLKPNDTKIKELFFPQGTEFDAYKQIKDIVSEAVDEVIIIDPYIGGSIFSIIRGIQNPPETVKILGSKFVNDFSTQAKKFSTQFNAINLQVRRSKGKEFHDRFIVNDSNCCWHIGCSIEHAGSKAFMVSEIEDEMNKAALLSQISSSWQNSQIEKY